jgi:O-antigen biosynthesis protein WbqP
MKRLFDLFLLSLALPVLAAPLVLVAVLVCITSKGPSLYWSARVGRGNQIFQMPKFRTMRVGTPAVATHLLESPESYLTPIGSFLRKSSLDELPQLWSILKGDMSTAQPGWSSRAGTWPYGLGAGEWPRRVTHPSKNAT